MTSLFLVSKEKQLFSASTITVTTDGSKSSDDQVDLTDNEETSDDLSVEGYFEESFIQQMNENARLENLKLNLNLGLPVDPTILTCRNVDYTNHSNPLLHLFLIKVLRPPVQVIIHLLHRFLLLIENPIFHVWSNLIPLKMRQKLTFLAWRIFFSIHKMVIGRRTGLHKDVSLEYHALTSVMWWTRMFPITVQRMRFSLSQLHVCHPPTVYPSYDLTYVNDEAFKTKPTNGERYGIKGHIYEVYHQMKKEQTPTNTESPLSQSAAVSDDVVTGLFIQHSSLPSQRVIFWVYGGAYLAGDSKGNLGIAEKMGMMCGLNEDRDKMMDVFIPDYRLIPEFHLDDAIHDITLAYEYLIYERRIKPENVIMLGISSGGGLVVLLLQALAEAQRKYEESNELNSRCVSMPKGAVLVCPFVDYTEPKGSMKEYIKHDLIVNQSVFEEGVPFLEKTLGSHKNRVEASPVYGNFIGLPPLCVCVSKHEVVYDQAMILVERAKKKNVDVTLRVWKYMCHVFPMLCPFIPEGRESFNFICDWIKNH